MFVYAVTASALPDNGKTPAACTCTATVVIAAGDCKRRFPWR